MPVVHGFMKIHSGEPVAAVALVAAASSPSSEDRQSTDPREVEARHECRGGEGDGGGQGFVPHADGKESVVIRPDVGSLTAYFALGFSRFSFTFYLRLTVEIEVLVDWTAQKRRYFLRMLKSFY